MTKIKLRIYGRKFQKRPIEILIENIAMAEEVIKIIKNHQNKAICEILIDGQVYQPINEEGKC